MCDESAINSMMYERHVHEKHTREHDMFFKNLMTYKVSFEQNLNNIEKILINKTENILNINLNAQNAVLIC